MPDNYVTFKSAIRLMSILLCLSVLRSFGQATGGDKEMDFMPSVTDTVLTVPEFTISPTSVKAGEDFSLSVLSYKNNCATTYSNLSVDLDERAGRITLSYLPKEVPGILCPAIHKPYGPVFKLRGLKPGKYTVQVVVLVPCLVTQPACELAVQPRLAGVLTVMDNKKAWQIKPASVEENQAFRLQILSEKYGNCGTEFPHTEVSVNGNTILLGYSVQRDSGIVCFANIIPWGPVFQLKPLNSGIYKVLAVEKPACLFNQPSCKIMEPAPEEIGTLTVRSNTIDSGTRIFPEQVYAEKPFKLTVTSSKFKCNAEFLNKSVAVSEGKITLKYDLAMSRIACLELVKFYSTDFPVPGLKAGKYDVYMVSNNQCDTKISSCLEPGISIGKISVADSQIKTGALLQLQERKPDIEILPDRLAITITDSGIANIWADLFNSRGIRIIRKNLGVTELGVATLNLPMGLEKGIYFLLLTYAGSAVYSNKLVIDR